MFLQGACLLALFLIRTAVASPAPAASLERARALGAVEFNERVWTPPSANESRYISRRAEDTAWSATHPGLKDSIDAAVAKTAGKPHFFWSGRTLPALSEDDSVMPRAMQIAKSRGGTTLELTVEDVDMPPFSGKDPDRKEIWQYASDEYAVASKGDAYFVKGESLRSGNVWEVYEYPRLKKSTVVKRIYQILVHKLSTELPVQIWPEVKGCDGVFLIDKHVTCPAGAKLYYGSPKKPMVTAKTTVAADATVKVSASGNAPGVTRECVEILSGEFVTEVFAASGACDALTAKGNGGKVMTNVKNLLDSTKNRNYMQQQRLIKTAAKVVGTPIISALKSSLLDSLVAIDYYDKTQAETAAMAQQIDSAVSAVTGKSPGLAAAWAAKTAGMKPAKATLLAELQREIAEKVKQAKETAARNAACKTPSPPGSPKPASPKPPPRMARRHLSGFSPAPLSTLERRIQKAPRSGPKAPAAPSCPLPGAKPKKVVPRDKVKTKPAPATKPRVAQRKPQAKPPSPDKKRVKRPATRPRRQPGKAAPKKRITPKKMPRKVPRPTKKPKGKPRPRRR